MARSLYDRLGVGRSASDAEITKAYRKLAKECHPDLKPGDKKAEERFKEISAAYDILGDKDKRARYDRGEIDEEGREKVFAGGFSGFGRQQGSGGTRYEFKTGGPGSGGAFGFEDILSELFGGRAAGGGAGRQGRAGSFSAGAAGGEDQRFALDVEFLEAANGAVKRVSLPDGSTLDVTIPAGVESGAVLRLRGKGRPGPTGEAGDALVEIQVRPHDHFTRQGLDILCDQPVPLETAVLGGKVRVQTISGEVSVTVPKGSSSGSTLRLRGKGIRDAKTDKRGDQLVRLMVQVPAHDGDLEAWARRRGKVAA
jgi:DnaJ-class molecular chaperone